MLKQRVPTALAMVLVLGVLLFSSSYTVFAWVCAGIFAIAAWEWAGIAGWVEQKSRVIYAAVVFAVCAGLLVCAPLDSVSVGKHSFTIGHLKTGLGGNEWLRDVFGIACLWWAIALLWVMSYPSSSSLWGSRPVRSVIGLVVLIPTWLGILYLHNFHDGQWLILYLLGVVAAADTGAYFAGKAFGKAKLAPKVSPGKSWAGFWGGLTAAALFSCGLGVFYQIAGLSWPELVAVSLVTSLASVLGDLTESMMKRHAGIKDSSNLLPGHGGILDRLDSLSAAVPVFALLVLLLNIK